MQRLFVLDHTQGYLPTLLLAAAAYASEGADALLVNPARDAGLIRQAVERFTPAEVLAMGALPAGALPKGYGPKVQSLPVNLNQVLAYLVEDHLPAAMGAVLFPAHSPSWAIKAGAIAARLGYLAWPVEEALGMALGGPPRMDILVVGEAPGNLNDILQGRQWTHLAGDRAVAAHLQERGVAVDYVVVVNSADLTPPQYHEEGLAGYWTPALSLLAPAVASYRAAIVIDARTPRPDARQIEAIVNQKVRDVELHPRYMLVLGSPGAVPFVFEPQVEFKSGPEEYTRDIRLRLDGDGFIDCAEGRIFALETGRASHQILTTKHYAALEGAWKQQAVVAARPHVLNGITFAIDEAVGKAQLTPVLAHAGLKVSELYDKDCTPAQIAPQLAQAGLFFYGGHGSPLGLATHGRPFTADLLPDLPPLVAYACACSTMRPRPFLLSEDGGLNYQPESVPPAEVIGPAFVEKGALAFVGGLTAEDVLLNTPMYAVFFQKLVLEGQPLGECVRAARNYALLLGQVLSQQDPVEFRRARPRLAETVGQQLLLGDPAFAPYPGAPGLSLVPVVSAGAGELTVQAQIPESAWRQEQVPVDADPWSKEYHRAGRLDLRLPVAGNVMNYGECYPVAPDAEGISARGVAGGYLHLWADLPAGTVPERIELTGADLADAECLLCGHGHPAPSDPVQALTRFRLHYSGEQPALKYDYTRGWAFALQESGAGVRAHWLVPTLIIDEPTRQMWRVQGARFKVVLADAVHATGRLELPGSGKLPDSIFLTFGRPLPAEAGARPGDELKLQPVCQVMAFPDGTFSAWLPAQGELGVKVGRPFPAYDQCYQAPSSYRPWTFTGLHAGDGPLYIRLAPLETGTLVGTVIDVLTGRPLEKALVRVWNGGEGGKHGPFKTGYVTQLVADHNGRFKLEVPYGEYVVAAQTSGEHHFFPDTRTVTVYTGHPSAVVLGLAPAADLRGQVQYTGPYRPRAASVRVVPLRGKEHKPLSTGFVRRDGTFHTLVPTNQPWALVVETEGFRKQRDDNGGKGYRLAPGEQMLRELTLEPDPEG